MKAKNIKEVIRHLKNGGIVVYPTETAYGLGCDATNQKAVDLIFAIKQRDKEKILPVIVGSLTMAEKWAVFTDKEKELAQKFWPGPLTLILPAKKKLAEGCLAQDNTIALRVSGNDLARGLAEQLGMPIVATSANLSGTGEIYDIKEFKNVFAEAINKYHIGIIDGGLLFKRAPSTIARVEAGGKVTILRQGELKIV